METDFMKQTTLRSSLSIKTAGICCWGSSRILPLHL